MAADRDSAAANMDTEVEDMGKWVDQSHIQVLAYEQQEAVVPVSELVVLGLCWHCRRNQCW